MEDGRLECSTAPRSTRCDAAPPPRGSSARADSTFGHSTENEVEDLTGGRRIFGVSLHGEEESSLVLNAPRAHTERKQDAPNKIFKEKAGKCHKRLLGED